MKQDDHPDTTGRILTRRQALALLGGAALAPLGRPAFAQDAARPLPSCVATPEQTEGPYFVDEKLRRSDIRSDPAGGALRPGTPLQLALQVSQLGAGGCTPLANTLVDVWHCDAAGLYSDVSD
ncbi:MAG: twin-arginine translocation pathway signal protein, partial [Proteobacteria bacterium]|nr:twin-arginine translocation pathway signal protein [Pseudomonadota bacterium]